MEWNLLFRRAEEEVKLFIHLAAESLSIVSLRTARLYHVMIYVGTEQTERVR